jgi:hypothetical protein
MLPRAPNLLNIELKQAMTTFFYSLLSAVLGLSSFGSYIGITFVV